MTPQDQVWMWLDQLKRIRQELQEATELTGSPLVELREAALELREAALGVIEAVGEDGDAA